MKSKIYASYEKNLIPPSPLSEKVSLDRELLAGVFPLLSHSRFVKEDDGCSAGGAQGRLPLKLTHISLLRPWVLRALSGSSGWICRSFHGPLILKWVCGQGRVR